MAKINAERLKVLINTYQSYYDIFKFDPDQPCLTINGLEEFIELIETPDVNGDTDLIPEIRTAIRQRRELQGFRESIITLNSGQYSRDELERMESLRQKLDPRDEELRWEIQKGLAILEEKEKQQKS